MLHLEHALITDIHSLRAGREHANNNSRFKSFLQYSYYYTILHSHTFLALLQKIAGLKHRNPATSCSQILNVKPNAPSRYYWLHGSSGSVIQVFCNMTLFPCQPGFIEVEAMCERERKHKCTCTTVLY